jgi:mono/diheme cytochrome c family protein
MSSRAFALAAVAIAALAFGALAFAAASSAAEGVAPTPPPQPMVRNGQFVMQGGAEIYTRLCQGCHMADAKGASGAAAYPALANDPRLASAAYPVLVIVRGQKAMPPFGGYLSDAQVAEAVNYIRSHFGNHWPGEVTAAQVHALR